MTKSSFEIEKNLYLTHIADPAGRGAITQQVAMNVNHIVVIDCSGSMYGELPKLRQQLKAKLPKMMREGDTLSLIWFSGRKQSGVLLEAEPIATLKDLNTVNQAIDRWLQPQGLTGFCDPLNDAKELVHRVAKKNSNQFAMFFMSDGGDNQWPRNQILSAVKDVPVAQTTIVEYGYYADRALLSAMAAQAGGKHIFADQFDKFETALAEQFVEKVSAAHRVAVSIPGDVIGGIAFTVKDRDIIAYTVDGGVVAIPDDTENLWYLAPKTDVSPEPATTFKSWAAPMYAAMSVFATRMKPDVVYPLLKSTGDVRFINMFSTCFGKQKYTQFMEETHRAAFDKSARLKDGFDPTLVPPDDAFTVFDLLHILAEDDSTRLLLDHPEFKYSRISRAREQAEEHLTAAEQEKLLDLQVQMNETRDKTKLRKLQDEINVLLAPKDKITFTPTPQPKGYEISSLTYNETRPNISVLVKKEGTVDLSVCSDKPKKVPDEFPTYIFRNYAIVRDGLVNVDMLPVRISKALVTKLKKAGVTIAPHGAGDYVIDVGRLPLLNRKMVKEVSAEQTIRIAFELEKQRAYSKVVKDYRKAAFPDAKIEGWKEKYGDVVATWLQDKGLTEYKGFSPKMIQKESTDFIVGKDLEIKLKGLSTLPTVKVVKDKVASGGKLTFSESLMAPAVLECEKVLKSPAKLHKDFFTGAEKSSIAKARGLSHQLSQVVFSIVVGQTWFKEFPTIGENTMEVDIEGTKVNATCVLKEVEIKI